MYDPKKQKLATWASEQRKAYREGRLTKKQIKKLEEVGFVFQLPDMVKEKKAKLLEMARNGEPRPSKEKTSIGVNLASYVSEAHQCYDPSFLSELKRIRPDWFIDTAAENKTKLLKIARNGEPRPNQKTHPLGEALCRYLYGKSASFDKEFADLIMEIRPDWFERYKESPQVTMSKSKLIQMAKNGKDRPSYRKNKLGLKLKQFTCKANSSYDLDFDKEIRSIRPDWFRKTNLIKDALLKMAKNKSQRPTQKDGLGNYLSSYTRITSSAYDEAFDKEVRELCPEWFEKTSDLRKKLILEVAKNNLKLSKKLLSNFKSYVLKSSACYDPAFDAEIRAIAPDWFVKKKRV